jgi:hypothetical protein
MAKHGHDEKASGSTPSVFISCPVSSSAAHRWIRPLPKSPESLWERQDIVVDVERFAITGPTTLIQSRIV